MFSPAEEQAGDSSASEQGTQDGYLTPWQGSQGWLSKANACVVQIQLTPVGDSTLWVPGH